MKNETLGGRIGGTSNAENYKTQLHTHSCARKTIAQGFGLFRQTNGTEVEKKEGAIIRNGTEVNHPGCKAIEHPGRPADPKKAQMGPWDRGWKVLMLASGEISPTSVPFGKNSYRHYKKRKPTDLLESIRKIIGDRKKSAWRTYALHYRLFLGKMEVD